MSATLDDIHKVLQEIKDCTPCPPGGGAPGTGTATAPGTGTAAAAGAAPGGGPGGAVPSAEEVQRMNELNDAYEDHQRKLSELTPGTKDYALSLIHI